MAEKLCIFCENCSWVNSRGMGSEWTGEYGTSGFNCKANHYSADDIGEDRSFEKIDDVRSLFLIAENCKDYLPPK